MTKREASDAIRAAMTERGLSFAELATQLGRPRVWVAAAALGQHPFSREEAEKLAATLGLPAEAVAALERSRQKVGWMRRFPWTRRSTVCMR